MRTTLAHNAKIAISHMQINAAILNFLSISCYFPNLVSEMTSSPQNTLVLVLTEASMNIPDIHIYTNNIHVAEEYILFHLLTALTWLVVSVYACVVLYKSILTGRNSHYPSGNHHAGHL